jgi:hypothetical protein
MNKLYLILALVTITACQNPTPVPPANATVLMVTVSNFLGSECARVDLKITNLATNAQFSAGVDRPSAVNTAQTLLEVKQNDLSSGTSMLVEAWCRRDGGAVEGYSKKNKTFVKDGSEYWETFFVSPRASAHTDEITAPGPRFDVFSF